MKSKIILGLIMTMSLSFTTLPVYALSSNVVSSAPIQGILNNKIKFEVVNTKDAPQVLMEMVNKRKEGKGFIYSIDDSSGYIYIAVMSGERSTGGYSIEVTGIEDNEGRTNVFVNELTSERYGCNTSYNLSLHNCKSKRHNTKYNCKKPSKRIFY